MDIFTLFKMMGMAATAAPLPPGTFVWGVSTALNLSGASQGDGLYTYIAGSDTYKHPDSGYRFVIGRNPSGYYIFDFGLESNIYSCSDNDINGTHGWTDTSAGESVQLTITDASA